MLVYCTNVYSSIVLPLLQNTINRLIKRLKIRICTNAVYFIVQFGQAPAYLVV